MEPAGGRRPTADVSISLAPMRLSLVAFGILLLLAGVAAPFPVTAAPMPNQIVAVAQSSAPAQRSFRVVLRKYAIEPSRIEINQDDLVKITLTSADIAHSFTVDEYRIAKRVGPGQTVTFEFRADQPGRFPVYCNLRQDDRCREIHGELIVHAR
jgi:Cupredoxin-like domain